MTRSNSEIRQRLVVATADMLRRRGLNATSVRDLARHAKAPLGSTYHYFPGGKQQLVTEAVQLAGDVFVGALSKALQAGPVGGLHVIFALWREIITGTDFRAGCPVLAVSIEEASGDDAAAVLAAAAAVFATWEKMLSESLRQHGAAAGQADQLATLIVAAVEGSVVLCRAKRSAEPLDHIAVQLEALVSAAICR